MMARVNGGGKGPAEIAENTLLQNAKSRVKLQMNVE